MSLSKTVTMDITEPTQGKNDIIMTSVKNTSKITRKSKRKRKKVSIYDPNKYETKSKKQKKPKNVVHEEPKTKMELRELHSQKIANIFQRYIFDILDGLDLPEEREKTRVTGLIKSLKNSISLKDKVFVSKNMGYLVSSSDGTQTYNVKQQPIGDNVKYVCNCGEKYEDGERTTCKHSGSIIFNIFDTYMSDYLKKPYSPNINLELNNINNMFNSFDIDHFNIGNSSEETIDTSYKSNYFSYLLDLHP